MSTCTWEGCNRDASVPQVSEDGEAWANLCGAHAWDLEYAIAGPDPRETVRAWIKAQGGAVAAARRMSR